MSTSLRIKTTAFLLFLLAVIPFSLAQRTFLTISGKITDGETSNPVPYANIGIAGRGIGTVSNEDGAFIFKVPERYGQDSLKVSFIGYQTFTKLISEITDGPITISLKPAIVELEEVLVEARRKSALEIIKEAIAAIPSNYDTSATQLRAFYREETTLEDNEITFIEAVMEVNRPSYASIELDDQIRTVKEKKKNLDHSKDYMLYNMLTLGGGAKYAIRSGDFVRFYKKPHKHSMLNEKNLRHYEFNIDNIISDGQRSMYVIELLPKSKKAYVQGKIYLDVQSLAFVRWEFELTESGLDLENNRKALLKKIQTMVVKANLKLSYFKEVMNFENHNNKWYVKDVQRDFEALVNSKKRSMENSLWKTNLFLTVTNINRINGELSQSENIYVGEDSGKHIIDDESFWENFNIIHPTSASKSGEFTIYTDSTSTFFKEANQEPISLVPNRQNGFTRADTLRGKLSSLRTCYDVSFYDLDVKVDIDNQFISGSNKIRFLVKEPFSSMQVDLYANMEIQKILYGKTELAYTREFNAVFIEFPNLLKEGMEEEITVFYSGKPKVPNRDIPMDGGFMWEKDREGNSWVQVVCQGSGASLWWPNKDHLSDEPDSVRISVTVPNDLINISNGRLRSTTELPGSLTRYEWYVTYPINNYNVTLIIGKYAHLQDQYITDDTLTIDYYIMPYNLKNGKIIFEGVKPMLAVLESHYGKYPFPRDGFKLMESLYPMEHQSAVSFGKIPEHEIKEPLQAPMSLIWHEVAHEWWGNNVSCKDMADMWFHEAFATYSERLYMMSVFGEEGEAGFMESLPDQVLSKEPVIGIYDVNHIHYDIGDMYGKGALVLHTFRNVLDNDSLWSEILLGIQEDFRYQTITTDDLINYINAKTKTDYTYFFDQYLKYTSLPKLSLKLEEKDNSLVVQYKWQADVDNFRMPIRVTTSVDNFEFILPTNFWQSLNISNMSYDDFGVDQDSFFIEVEVD